jgi:hypothetical protein
MSCQKVYTLFVSEHGLPTIVSQYSLEYPDFVQCGAYKVEMEGTYRECQDRHDEILETFIHDTINAE